MNNKIKKAVRILKKGGIVAFPTETVYGLGARLYDAGAVGKVYRVKNRPADNPLIVHISSMEQFKLLTTDVPHFAAAIMKKFWPGPLTLVCRKSARVPVSVTAGLNTVAVRMPSNPVAHKLISALGEPIAAPSANLSGRPSPTRYLDVVKELRGKADFVLDGGKSEVGLESTVLDVTGTPCRILRPGFITVEDLKKFVPSVKYGHGKDKCGAPASPGTKHAHYKPSCTVILADSRDWDAVFSRLSDESLRIGVLSLTKTIPRRKNIVFRRHLRGSAADYAHKLYSYFFAAERENVQILVVESIEKKGLGRAIMDRLTRASAP